MQTTYNELIGYNTNGAAVILLYTFDYGSGFPGAVGTILELLSKGEYDERTCDEALKDYAEELWREDAGQPNGTTDSLEDWTEAAREDLLETMFDGSYSGLVPDGDYVATHCIEAGRIFPSALNDIVTWMRPDLADVIREVERWF